MTSWHARAFGQSDTSDERDEVAPILLFLGYSIYMAVMLDSYITDFGGVGGALGYVSNIPFMAAASLGIALATAAVFIRRHRRPEPFSLPHVVPSCALALGYVLAQVIDMTSAAALVLLGLLWGGATTLLTAVFMELITARGTSTLVMLQLASGTFFSGVLRMALEETPQGAGMAVRLMLIAVFCCSIGIVRRAFSRTEGPSDGPPVASGSAAAAMRLAAMPIVAYVFFDAAIGLVNMYAYCSGESLFTVASSAPMWGMLICAGLLIGFAFFSNRIASPEIMTLAVFPLAIGMLLLLPFLNESAGERLSAVLYGANTFTSTLSMFCCIAACRATASDICLVTALVRLIARAVLMVGLALGYLFARAPGSEPTVRTFMVVAVCVYLLLVVIVYGAARAVRARPAHDTGDAPATAPVAGPAGPTADATRGDATQTKLSRVAEKYALSPRECEVFGLLLQGGTAKSIAERLGLSPNTVQGHVQKLYAKLGVNKKDQAIELYDREA